LFSHSNGRTEAGGVREEYAKENYWEQRMRKLEENGKCCIIRNLTCCILRQILFSLSRQREYDGQDNVHGRHWREGKFKRDIWW